MDDVLELKDAGAGAYAVFTVTNCKLPGGPRGVAQTQRAANRTASGLEERACDY